MLSRQFIDRRTIVDRERAALACRTDKARFHAPFSELLHADATRSR